ncbi:bacillithiol system redox-active protein YtxJ [soil metagenome]
MLNWISLTSVDELQVIKEKSFQKPQILFKHSTRCGTSVLVLNRLERSKEIPDADFYFLDLIRYRDISNAIAHLFNVYHESPQVILIKNGECHYEESHLGIDMFEISDQITSLN